MTSPDLLAPMVDGPTRFVASVPTDPPQGEDALDLWQDQKDDLLAVCTPVLPLLSRIGTVHAAVSFSSVTEGAQIPIFGQRVFVEWRLVVENVPEERPVNGYEKTYLSARFSQHLRLGRLLDASLQARSTLGVQHAGISTVLVTEMPSSCSHILSSQLRISDRHWSTQ